MAPIRFENKSMTARSTSGAPGEATEPAHLPVWFWCLLAAAAVACFVFFIYKSVQVCRKPTRTRDGTDNALVEAGTFQLEEPISKPPRVHSPQHGTTAQGAMPQVINAEKCLGFRMRNVVNFLYRNNPWLKEVSRQPVSKASSSSSSPDSFFPLFSETSYLDMGRLGKTTLLEFWPDKSE